VDPDEAAADPAGTASERDTLAGTDVDEIPPDDA
jgi:hypothetical protein